MNTSEDAEAARVERVYGRYARSRHKRRAWAADNPGNVELRRELLAALLEVGAAELSGDGRILDAGCGGGRWLSELAQRDVTPERLYGVDLRAERLTAAAQVHPEVTFVRSDVRRLPFPDGHFSLVIAFTLLSSLASAVDVRTTLDELRRGLAPEGAIVVYEPRVPNVLNPSVRLIRIAELADALGPPQQVRSLTVAPPLTRRLGRSSHSLYPQLARLPLLRTHRLLRFAPHASL